MVKNKEKWDQMVQITSVLGGMKIFAGIALLITMPDNTGCPSVSVSSLYFYPVLCIFLGMTWIGRGNNIRKIQAGGELLPTVYAQAPDGQAVMAAPAK